MDEAHPRDDARARRRKRPREGYGEGDVIADRYEVLQRVGRGGMGIVYKVRDSQSGDTLALKSILPQYASNNYAVARFLREIDAIRQLNHPCIVKVYHAKQIDTLLFYTMEYVEGRSLYEYMKRRGQLGLGSTVRVLSLLCHALAHAHTLTIHRDLSPDNVMILPNGSIKLLDFGLAKITAAESQFTMIGVNLGKREYNAPEQRANARDVDLRADLYSVGVMFFEMLAGQRPEEGDRLSGFRPDLPQECDAFADKAMADAPEDRYQSADEMRLALARLYEIFSEQETPSAGKLLRIWKRCMAVLRWPWAQLVSRARRKKH